MSAPHPQRQPRWSDEDVELLLFDFFRREMPPELRDLESPTAVSQPAARLERPNRSAAAAGLTVAGCALLLMMAVLVSSVGNPPASDPGASHGDQSAAGQSALAVKKRRAGIRTVAAQATKPRKRGGRIAPIPGGVLPVELQTPWGSTVYVEPSNDPDWDVILRIRINSDTLKRRRTPPHEDRDDE